MKDKEIIECLQGTERDKNKAFNWIIKESDWLDKLHNMLRTKGATRADVEDVFLEGITVLNTNICEENFRGESAITTYLYRIFVRIYFRKYHNKNMDFIEGKYIEIEENPEDVNKLNDRQELKKIIHYIFESMKGDCPKTLKLKYMNGLEMREIIKEFDKISKLQSVKTKVLRCRQKLRKLITSNEKFKKLLDKWI